MLKRIIIVNLILVSLLFPNLFFADTILLKSGVVMEGEILSESDTGIEFKSSSGGVEKIKRNSVASIIKEGEELPLNPEQVYLEKAKSISPKDAKAHYELGLFCLENELLDYALKEFDQAIETDPKYEGLTLKHIKYIDSVKKETEKMMEADNKAQEEIPPLTSTEVTKKIQKGDLFTPYNQKDIELIVKAINALNSNKLKQEYAQKYLELAGYLEETKMGSYGPDEYKFLQNALFYYDIVFQIAQNSQTRNLAQRKIIEFERKLEEARKAQFVIPYSESDRDAVILYIRNLKYAAGKESYYGRYYQMGDEVRAKVTTDSAPLKEEDRKNLKIALHCYEIVKNAYFKDILFSHDIEAKIKECKERLKE